MFDRVRMIARRHAADRLSRSGQPAAALAAYREAAEYWTTRSAILAASNWRNVAKEAVRLEDRTTQLAACERALALIYPPPRYSPLAMSTYAEALGLAADALHWLDRLVEGEDMARRAVEAAREARDQNLLCYAFGVRGQVLLRLGRPAGTLGCTLRVLELARANGAAPLVAAGLSDVAVAQWNAGQVRAAVRTGREALAAIDLIEDRTMADRLRLGVLATIAVLHRNTGDPAAAIEAAERSMALAQQYHSREIYLQARTTWALAQIDAGNAEPGATAFREVYDEYLARGARHLAGLAASNAAAACAGAGDLDGAAEWSERAVELEDSGDIAVRGAALFNRAWVQILRNDLGPARASLVQAINDWEAVRRDVTDDSMYVGVLEGQARAYRALQACDLAAGDPAGALEAYERARGSGLLRLLRQRAGGAGGTGPAPGLDLSSWTGPDGTTCARAIALAKLHEVGFLVYSLVPWMRSGNAVGGGQPGGPSDVAGVHGWFVDAAGVAHSPISPDALRALETGPHPELPDPFLGAVRDLPVPAPAADDSTEGMMDALSEMLVGPLRQALEGSRARRLVIVPDGELDRLPFAALRLDVGRATTGPGRTGRTIADRWSVSVVPAIAVYADLASRGSPEPGTPRLLLVGDPVPPDRPLAPELPVPELPRLAHAGREVRAVAELYGAGAPLLGAAATRAAVLSRITDCDLAHFATHGSYGSDEGATPGALCLSPDGDDGYLRADDVAGLDLRRCRIAVLSACRTGWGRDTFEGTLGLARSFLIAGVQAVVVSLWPVFDAGTADLMIALHRELHAGVPVGEALRRSAVAARELGAPFDVWASFTVVGNPEVRIAAASAGVPPTVG